MIFGIRSIRRYLLLALIVIMMVTMVWKIYLWYGQDVMDNVMWLDSHHDQPTVIVKKGPNSTVVMMPAFRPTPPADDGSRYGQNGRAVVVPAVYKEESDRLFTRNRFNQWASDRISLHRTLPDQRPSA